MTDIPKFERLLKMLLTLSGPRNCRVGELREKYNISESTCFRDIRILRNAGFAIEQRNGCYWIDKLEPPFKELHDLLFFTEEEAYILKRAIHSIDDDNFLKQQLSEKLYALYNYSKVTETIVRREHSETVHTLHENIKAKKQVILKDYKSANGNTISDRLVEPFGFTANFIALWAFDTQSMTNKVFKTSRIKSVFSTDEACRYTEQHKKSPMDVFRISGPEKTKVKLKLSLRAFNLLVEEFPLAEKYIQIEKENVWLYDGWVCSFEGVGRFILGLCGEVEILEPTSLSHFVKEKMKQFLK